MLNLTRRMTPSTLWIFLIGIMTTACGGIGGMMAPMWLWTIIGVLVVVLLIVLILKLSRRGPQA